MKQRQERPKFNPDKHVRNRTKDRHVSLLVVRREQGSLNTLLGVS